MSLVYRCRVQARSYEMDAFGHLNHAVFLNYFEYARFQAFRDAGYPADQVTARGEGIHVVRVEVDYLKEVFLGQDLEILTRVESSRNSSMTLLQEACGPGDPDSVHARARVVIVWVGPDRRPMRIPAEVRSALGIA
ncbi:MAG TPA: thioesterase family protein [Longimicrobiales bacterium]|nr:thioesterase family protein [Longimicrobiales bacterium]